MLTIVLGILIVLLIVFLFAYFTNMSLFLVATIAMWSMMGILYLGLFCPLSGYNDWRLVEETPLVSLSNSTATEGKGNLIYVSISAENVYSYRYKIESEIKTENAKTYKVDTKSEADVNYKIAKDNFNIEDISTHSLRHTFGTRCVEGGMRDAALQRLMGHGSVSATLDNYVSIS